MKSLEAIKKKAAAALVGSSMLVLAAAGITFASVPDFQSTENIKAHNPVPVTIPYNATQVAQNVFELPSAIDPQTGKVVQGYMIVHYKNPQANSSARIGSSKPSACYTYLSKGAKWKNLEPWIMNTSNTRGLDGGTVFSLMQSDINKWKDATDGNISNGSGVDILGNGSTTSEVLSSGSSADGQNEVYFAPISGNNAIAVTTVWGYFYGPASSKELVEWDMVFDDADFNWSTTGASDKMDFENISTHELGHAAGLGDLYNSCTDETMYGYADNGETKKRDLNTGDIQGINNLY